MHLIACLGNPGSDYKSTRHNAGFILGDRIKSNFQSLSDFKKFRARVYSCAWDGGKILFLYPETFMNLSGQSVQAALSYYKVPLSNLLVVYDDFDLPLGTLRFRQKGGAGTHNGMRSIVSSLANTEFCRLRVGIGPLPAGWKVADFVLSAFGSDDMARIEACSNTALKCVTAWIAGDLDLATRESSSLS